MAAESSRSSSTADSYIGSLISLTSKSEIRYEGVLSHINTEESSIGLHNVRSFGTEGRKKDGPQVMPSDKVYEYILFRGSDIKDLQVKSSPPVQQAPPINSDPAIIQSHYPRAASTPSSIPSTGTASLSDISTHPTQLGHPGSTFQSGLPLYQPGGNIGSWGPSPQNANNSGLAMPMYWPGYYGPTNGLPLHQQSLLRPPAGLSMPPSMQQYPGFNAPLPTGSSTSSLTLTSTSLSASNFPSNLPPVPPMMLASEPLPTLVPNKPAIPAAAGAASTATATLIANLPSLSNPDVNAVVPPTISNKPNLISAPPLTYQPISHPVSSITGNSSLVVQTETPTPPPLVTPGQLIQSGQASLSQTVAQAAHKDVEVVQVSPTPTPPASEPLQAPIATEAQPPILPLPSPSRTVQKPNGAHYQARHNYRGRERGRGSGQSSRPTMKFTEEFDFTAMNEKFNKDEVWGHLGRSNKSSSKEKVGDGNGSDEYDSEDEDDDDAQLPKIEVKPVYSKDDFFDTLSCNSLDNQSNNGGRTRFSEQRKIDTETFGEFSRYRGGWGGRGPGRGGRSRGGYGYGSRGYGYGYGGRGRGGRNNMGNRDF